MELHGCGFAMERSWRGVGSFWGSENRWRHVERCKGRLLGVCLQVVCEMSSSAIVVLVDVWIQNT